MDGVVEEVGMDWERVADEEEWPEVLDDGRCDDEPDPEVDTPLADLFEGRDDSLPSSGSSFDVVLDWVGVEPEEGRVGVVGGRVEEEDVRPAGGGGRNPDREGRPGRCTCRDSGMYA